MPRKTTTNQQLQRCGDMLSNLVYLTFVAFFLLWIAGGFCCCEARVLLNTFSGDGDVVTTSFGGALRGVQKANHTEYLGIPFAEQPVGPLRFKPAKALERPWDGVLEATSFGPGCPQSCEGMGPAGPALCPAETEEACLYLNVYVPDGEPPAEGWPVFVWIHGGAFQNGAGGMTVDGIPLYGGDSFNDNGVILVTTNYRLGALGWLNYGEIEGNYGLSDQRMALKWVRDNIAAFGGDAASVTVGGESAGAMSILVHLASPASEGLFDRAVVESGTIALPYNSPDGPNTFYKHLMKFAGCPQHKEGYAECLMDISTADLLKAQRQVMEPEHMLWAVQQPADLVEPYYPVVGTEDVPLPPLQAFQEGKFNKVPLIIGNNEDEGALFVNIVFDKNKSLSKVLDQTVITTFFGPKESQAIRDEYDVFGDATDSRDVLSRIVTDYFFTGSTRKVAELFQYHDVPVHTYMFNYSAKTESPLPVDEICGGKVCHAMEIPFVFDLFRALGMSGAEQVNAEDERVAATVGKLWTDFIKANSSSSSGGGSAQALAAEEWPPFTLKDPRWLVIAEDTRVDDDLMEQKLNFWDKTVGYKRWPAKI